MNRKETAEALDLEILGPVVAYIPPRLDKSDRYWPRDYLCPTCAQAHRFWGREGYVFLRLRRKEVAAFEGCCRCARRLREE
jgi:hypothetical protein